MFKHKFLLTGLMLVVVSSLAISVGQSRATPQVMPGSGVTAQLIASKNLPEPVRVTIKDDPGIKIDAAQVLTYKITIDPGGYTGWHQHGGPHMMIVASGELTSYDPSCTRVVYPAGSSILDPGSDIHVLSNEGKVDVVTYLTEMLPVDGTLQIDVPVLTNFCNLHGPTRTRHLLK
jgi:quercetin dioxygenase-like cupin family protein